MRRGAPCTRSVPVYGRSPLVHGSLVRTGTAWVYGVCSVRTEGLGAREPPGCTGRVRAHGKAPGRCEPDQGPRKCGGGGIRGWRRGVAFRGCGVGAGLAGGAGGVGGVERQVAGGRRGAVGLGPDALLHRGRQGPVTRKGPSDRGGERGCRGGTRVLVGRGARLRGGVRGVRGARRGGGEAQRRQEGEEGGDEGGPDVLGLEGAHGPSLSDGPVADFSDHVDPGRDFEERRPLCADLRINTTRMVQPGWTALRKGSERVAGRSFGAPGRGCFWVPGRSPIGIGRCV